MDKHQQYTELVACRKACRACCGPVDGVKLTNPAETDYDVNEIGHWSVWYGDLDADITIVGQDWGDVACLRSWTGVDSDTNPTNKNLKDFLEIAGVKIALPQQKGKDITQSRIFLTNAILCMKNSSNGMQGKIYREWINHCGPKFLKTTIELVQPKAVISLGEWAYRSIRNIYSLPNKSFRNVMRENLASVKPATLSNGILFFPMYHCGNRVINFQGGKNKQEGLWRSIKPFIDAAARSE